MPTYEYECTSGHRFEVVQRITAEPLKRCKVCRSKVRRLISASAFILKGGGWYADGYSSSPGNGSKGDSKDTSSTESTESKSSGGEDKSSSKKDKSSSKSEGSSKD